MGTFLFNELVFGPVKSRRLGNSLGINLLPINKKVCNFNCIYCECGLTENINNLNESKLPTVKELFTELEKKLLQLQSEKIHVDTITFAGNGEPTLHPKFAEIIDKLINFRNNTYPDIKIAVLSNASRISDQNIKNALNKIDYNILKLDSVFPSTVKLINCPTANFDLMKTIENLKQFNGELIIQTMFFKGIYKNKQIDNTIEKELKPLIDTYKQIKPDMVMIYTIARDTPFDTLYKIPVDVLAKIAKRIEKLGIAVQIST